LAASLDGISPDIKVRTTLIVIKANIAVDENLAI